MFAQREHSRQSQGLARNALSLKIGLLAQLLRWVVVIAKTPQDAKGTWRQDPARVTWLMTGWHCYFGLGDTSALHFTFGIGRIVVARVVTLLKTVCRFDLG